MSAVRDHLFFGKDDLTEQLQRQANDVNPEFSERLGSMEIPATYG